MGLNLKPIIVELDALVIIDLLNNSAAHAPILNDCRELLRILEVNQVEHIREGDAYADFLAKMAQNFVNNYDVIFVSPPPVWEAFYYRIVVVLVP